MAEGGCLCGAVRYAVSGPLRPVVFCHCTQCRKTSGHYFAATACDPARLSISGEASLRWYRSSGTAERGFCARCGSSLFWRPDHGRFVSILAGSLETPTGLEAGCHIYVDDRSDYYTIEDGLPRYRADYPEALAREFE